MSEYADRRQQGLADRVPKPPRVHTISFEYCQSAQRQHIDPSFSMW